MNVLIGYDGSVSGQVALNDLIRAGLAGDVTAEVLRIAEVWIPPSDAYTGPSLWEAAMRDVTAKCRDTVVNAQRDAQAAEEWLGRAFPSWTITTKVKTGPAALHLIERAEHWPADLVVVGAQKHAVIERLGIGSVALNILTHLRRSVRVARGTTSLRVPTRVLVGVDGSPDAEAALQAVADRNWPDGTEVRVITVVDHRVLIAPAGVELKPDAPASSVSQAIADAAAARLSRCGLLVSASVIHGDPKHVLVHAAREWEADCVFICARGLTRVERFLLGSVSTSIAMHASCSVEVVHPVKPT